MSGAWGTCAAGLQTTEICGDGKDQDCNGADLNCCANSTCSVVTLKCGSDRTLLHKCGSVAERGVERACGLRADLRDGDETDKDCTHCSVRRAIVLAYLFRIWMPLAAL